ncbi:hypothetical protein [Streptomyces aidingensis]|nr:hypothetical protein [Streptomyces aidingensis]
MRDYTQRLLQSWTRIPEEDIAPSRERLLDYYQRGEPYTDYNLDIEGEGWFWVGVANPDHRGTAAASACSAYGIWAERSETPVGQPLAVSPQTLAEAAYEWLPLPQTSISLSPDADRPQVVNLPTWIWQDTAAISEVSATAILDVLGLEVTTTAVPGALTLDPGTEDATLHPADGRCILNPDGTIGLPWTPAHEGETPPCGITCHRATPGTSTP